MTQIKSIQLMLPT